MWWTQEGWNIKTEYPFYNSFTCVLDESQKEAFVGADEVVEIVDKSVDNKGRSNVDKVGDELKSKKN